MDGPAPAILNAVEDALGVGFDSVPLLPEDIMERLAAASPVGSTSRDGGR
jgi:CO/xanthine dehydrogenase Mo-binding subunit